MLDPRHLPADGPLVVAVSGGADSLALWDLLALTPTATRRWRLIVWHLDHGLRPGATDLQALHALAARHRDDGVPAAELRCEQADIAALARQAGTGIEEAGRRHRYARLAAVAAEHGAGAVATAHHRDDQAETVLMHLLRGAADTGLAGIPATRPLTAQVALVRPLLGASRADLRAHLRQRGIAWAEDPSNDDRIWLRNRIRHQVLPAFERAAPGFTEALLAASAAARERQGRAEQALASAWQPTSAGELALAPLLALPEDLRRHAWRRLLVQLAAHPDRRRIAALDDLATGRPGRRYGVAGWLVRRRGRTLAWARADS